MTFCSTLAVCKNHLERLADLESRATVVANHRTLATGTASYTSPSRLDVHDDPSHTKFVIVDGTAFLFSATVGASRPHYRMADANATTPGSSTAKTPAAKDKECPYCHQAFTSSSLGRHLDLYIKDKNAKPPDNLHNVEEIRRLRGNVTRRQARTSSGKREGSTPSSSKPTPLRDQRSPSIQGGSSSNHQHAQHIEGGHIRTYLNKPTWQSTGVINDIPSMRDHTSPSRVQSPSRRHSVKEEILHKQRILEERDRARAAELALKEVLDSVRAAK